MCGGGGIGFRQFMLLQGGRHGFPCPPDPVSADCSPLFPATAWFRWEVTAASCSGGCPLPWRYASPTGRSALAGAAFRLLLWQLLALRRLVRHLWLGKPLHNKVRVTIE